MMSTDDLATPRAEIAGWRARLLDRIVELGTRRLLGQQHNYPVYRPGDRRGAVAIESWRARSRDLKALSGELEARAELTGIDPRLIAAAREAGVLGERWSEQVVDAPRVRADDPGRAPLLDAIAEDMWALEHMAALDVALGQRAPTGRRIGADPFAEQYDRNMAALWNRVNATAATAGLSETEQGELWGRDDRGWQLLVSRTTEHYLDLDRLGDLEEQRRFYAWAGIEWDAQRVTAALTADHDDVVVSAGRAPSPDVLIGRAIGAHKANRAADEVDIFGPDGTEIPLRATESVFDAPAVESWGAEPAGEPLPRPPELGPAPGPEW
ncbi:hypothetical protein V7968_32505 [Nocardia vulneris]|uniref:hypothetical protein n=1 Tax=Nocardia vulneris TaxID=1141657 RepID=UPI0030CAD3D5